MAGFLSNATFLAGFNVLVESFANHDTLPASRIYSLWYCCFIPLAHAINSLLVFGWPEPYLPSLLSNAPIGLTAMTIGTLLTGYLDRLRFDSYVEEFLASHVPLFLQPSPPSPNNNEEEEDGEFYSSLLVMAVTGIFSYLASAYANSSSSPSSSSTTKKNGQKKEL